jgi:hypothetical protein
MDIITKTQRKKKERIISTFKYRRKVMKTLTPQQIVALGPCKGYDLKQITELFDNKKSMTYLEILNTDKIPLADIVWLFCQLTVLDKDIRNQWMEVIVTRAVTNYALHCGIDTVEKWAENWLSGDDRTTEAAHVAAYAAIDATAYAAGYAAHAAACSATAAYSAARVRTIAARNNEYKQQIQDLKDILQGEK